MTTALERARATLLVAAVLTTSGCAYYNGIYNAKDAARAGSSALRQGRESDARVAFQRSAATAETVLVRYPKSKWRTRALFLAGRGEALAGNCEDGVPRLNAYLALSTKPSLERDQARVALSVCDVIHRRLAVARLRLDSLVDVKDVATSRQARLWAARAAIASGDRDAAARYFSTLDAASIQWEFIGASLQANDMTRAESLLVRRAREGDWRPDVPSALRDLWSAGRFDGVEEILQQYDMVRLRDSWRVTMHYLVGDMNLQAGRDSLARRHLFTARQLGASDTTIERESNARLALMALSRLRTLTEVDTVIARLDSTAKRSAYYRRRADQLLLYRLLQADTESTGATLFLAAEVARDSLRAPQLAFSTFMRIPRELPASPLAAKALHAAAVVFPDSAPGLGTRILTSYPGSSVAAFLRGEDPAARPDFAGTDSLLRERWLSTARMYADTLRKLREAVERSRAAAALPAPVRKP